MKEVEKRYKRGESIRDISKATGLGKTKIHNYLKKNSLVRSREEACSIARANGRHSLDMNREDKYWLGVLATDGSVFGNRISLQMRDLEHIEKFKVWSKSSNKIHVDSRKKNNIYCFSFSSMNLAKLLKKLGIVENKTFSLKVSPILASSSDFWRGAIDGDGWVGFYKSKKTKRLNIGLCGASIDFLVQYKCFLEQEGIATCGIGKTPSVFRTEVTGGKAEEVGKVLGYQYPNLVCLERKRYNFLESLNA